MVETVTFDITYIVIAAIVAVVVYFFAKSPFFQTQIMNKRIELAADYVKDLEEENADLKKEKRALKLKQNQVDAGPRIEGDINEMDELLPELVAQFEPMAPKWLKPLLGNKDTQKWLIKYVQENPAAATKFFGKLVKPKGSKDKADELQAEVL